MVGTRDGWARTGTVLLLSSLTLGAGLGSSARLSYHEAFVAQAAREMAASGDLVVPTVGGLPWLEKPPAPSWLAMLSGWAAGGLGETSARLPSALAAALLSCGVAAFAARRFGPAVGLLAGLIQATTVWTVTRGRLAEADIFLACLVTWTFVALDRLREGALPGDASRAFRWWRWGAFAGLGAMSLVKGVGFGAALTAAAIVPLVALDRDRKLLRNLLFWPGWALAAALTLAWPVLAAARHPEALGLWFLHVSDRFADRPEHFIGQTSLSYAVELFGQLLPWAPLAVWGAWGTLKRAVSRQGRGGGDQLLWAWFAGPLALLSMATVKNAHYAIHALPPCSVWGALGLIRLGERLQANRGWSPDRARRAALAGFGALGLAYALGFGLLGPRFDRRGREWAFYERAAASLHPGEPVALLYHVPEWDRKPYKTPFGPVPHDYAVRLFYLNRHASCQYGLDDLATHLPGGPFSVIGRAVDEAALRRFGAVETLAVGPTDRADRAYSLFRVAPPKIVAGRGEGEWVPR